MLRKPINAKARNLASGVCLLLGFALWAQLDDDTDPGLVTAPKIVEQPATQTAAFGANVTFTVAATGDDLRFQWFNGEHRLADYDNVAGASTASLTLIGVAQRDAGSYAVVIQNPLGVVTSAVATLRVSSTVLFLDDFESGTLSNWTAFSEVRGLTFKPRQDDPLAHLVAISRGGLAAEATRLTTSPTQNRSPAGSHSALVSSSRDKMFHNLGMELAGRTKATFWIYDDGSQPRCYGELRGYTGAGHGLYREPGGLKQSLAIGRYGVGFGANNGTGVVAGEVVDVNKYQGRVLRGKNTGWFNLNNPGTPDRSDGWHKFEIEREADGTTVHFYVDGFLGRTITDADHVLLDCVVIGSVGEGTGVGNAWFDDVTVEAFPWRFDWQRKDSVGKGLPDWMQLRETGTDSQQTDITQISTVSQRMGVGSSKAIGRWTAEESGIVALDMRGGVEYALDAPADNAYRIEIEGRARSGKHSVAQLPLIIAIDGETLGRLVLASSVETNGVIHCFTPFLRAGPHTVRVYWDNVESDISLYLHAIRLQALSGTDANANGVTDWVENRLISQNGIELASSHSLVSPVCVEGRGQYLSMMQAWAGHWPAAMTPVSVQPGAGHRWYADVPLAPGVPTQLVLHYQNGALAETRELVWKETNLLEAGDMAVRKGDALLLNAAPEGVSEGTVTITVVGVTNYTSDPTVPVIHRFDQAGDFTVTGAFLVSGRLSAASRSRSITVRVVEASFGGPVATWAAKGRYWDVSQLPPEVVLDSDPRLRVAAVTEQEDRLQLPLSSPTPNDRQYRLTNDAAEVRHVVARLGVDGPILASTPVEGFRLFNCYDTYLKYVHIYPDGSQLVEEALVLSPVLPNVTVQIHIIVSGVVFEDGTVTKTLTAADFDELGIYRVRYVRAAGVKSSVCHVTKAYQGDVLIGWPAYEK
ncbi:MAG: hypothetical protein KIS67_13760 [Verrucomicrobiae bacterium]|nr:hypothetical protein [Verrucomicrobiae bacterium]